MKSIAIITARGGSKRIPKKNIRDFLGKPILAYSIEAAIASHCFDTVMVSTDSEEIAGIARQYGAEVPFLRSARTSSDYATTADVLTEVLDEYEAEGERFDMMCCIYPTAPFVTAEKLRTAGKLLSDAGADADSLMPVVAFSFPPQRGNVIRNDRLSYIDPASAAKRSQDLEPVYHDCGQFYFCRTDAFRKAGKLVTGNTIPMILPEEEVQDIDNFSDWKIAELKYRTFILKETESPEQ